MTSSNILIEMGGDVLALGEKRVLNITQKIKNMTKRAVLKIQEQMLLEDQELKK